MPFYQYRCVQCKMDFEELIDFDEPEPDCPSCGNEVKRLLSTPSFTLKGDGWYSDHYGLKNKSTGEVNEQVVDESPKTSGKGKD